MKLDDQIHSLAHQFGERWNAYDTAGLARLFSPDATLVNAFGIAATGREAIEKFHVALFASVFKNGVYKGEATGLRSIRPDVVVADLRWSVTNMKVRPENPNGAMNGLMSMVLTRDGDSWQITTMHVMQFPSAQPTV
jgi:uncharacterized protein (TIGR02246 family)